MEDTWKKIPKFNYQYEVDLNSNIRSVFSVIIKSNGIKYTRKSKILTPVINPSGYFSGAISLNGKMISYLNHRIAAEIFIPNPLGKLEVNHKNGIKTDNRVENLEWVSHAENIQHAYKIGLLAPKVGSLNGMAKLTEKDVRKIRLHAAMNGRFYGRKGLATKYNVSECTIKEVVTRRKNKFYNA